MPPARFGSFAIFVGLLVGTVPAGRTAPVPKDRELNNPFIKWSVTEEFAGNEPYGPLVVKDLVVVGTEKGDLRAYRCQDGKPVWLHQHGKRIFLQPSTDGQRIYFTSQKGLTAVTVADGKLLWNFNLRSCDGPTLVLEKKGLVYVGGHDGHLYALNLKTGKQEWSSDFIADAPADPPGFDGAVARITNTKARPTAITTDGETLFLSVFDQCRIVAIDATTGKRRWSFQTKGWVYERAAATVDRVFVGSQDKCFYCLDKGTGKEVWKFATKSRVESGGVVDEKQVYFGSCDGGLYCLDQKTGKECWRFATELQSDGKPSAIYSVPVLHRGMLCFSAGEGQTYGVDLLSGKGKWKIRPSDGSGIYSSPVSDGSLFFAVTRAGNKGFPSLVAIGLR